MLLAGQFPQHGGNLLGVIHLLVQSANANIDVQCAANLVVVAFQTELRLAVPEDVGQGIGQLRVVVQSGAEAQQLARLLQDELAAEGEAGPPGEDGGDVARALKVSRKGAFQNGQFRAPGQAGREGDLGEGGVERVAVPVLPPRAEDDHVSLHGALGARDIRYEVEVLDLAELRGVGISGGAEDLLRHHVRRQRPGDDGARGEHEDVAAVDALGVHHLAGVEARVVRVDGEAVRRENLHHQGHVERLGHACCADGGGWVVVRLRAGLVPRALRLLGYDGDAAEGRLGRGRPGRFAPDAGGVVLGTGIACRGRGFRRVVRGVVG